MLTNPPFLERGSEKEAGGLLASDDGRGTKETGVDGTDRVR